MRELMRQGTSALLLLLIMFLGSLVLWIGVPLAWLWIGSQIEGATESPGTAIVAMLIGVLATVALLVFVLVWLSNRHRALRLDRGLEDTGHVALEAVLVTSAGVAVVAFALWFFVFAGTSPFPINVGF